MRVRLVVVLASVLVLPAVAGADGWISPFFGVNYGGALPDNAEPKTYGFGLGSMGAGVFGFETELSFSPDFLGESDDLLFGENAVLTWMNNIIIGVPVGGQSGFGVRPFFTAGVGLIRRRVEGVGDLLEISTNGFGYDVGGGVMIFMARHFGIRGDYRYYRNFQASDVLDFIDGEEEEFNFSRLSGAVVFRF